VVRLWAHAKTSRKALQFAAEGKVKATIEEQQLGSINDIFDRLKKGKVNGRIVLDIAGQKGAKKFEKEGELVGAL